MRIICPFCGHCETDAFEVLDVNRLYPSIPCGQCGGRFSLFIKECDRCEAEQVHVWKFVPPLEDVAGLPCDACGYSKEMMDETTIG